MTRVILALAALITALALAIGFVEYGPDPMILAPGASLNPAEWATTSRTTTSVVAATTQDVREAVIRSIVGSEPPLGGGSGTPRVD